VSRGLYCLGLKFLIAELVVATKIVGCALRIGVNLPLAWGKIYGFDCVEGHLDGH
jgi:hypothetical protein